MDEFFKDVHQQAKAVMYSVEGALSGLVPASTANKRATRTVQLRESDFYGDGAETERSQEVEDALLGVWVYGDGPKKSQFTIFLEDGVLVFQEGKRRGILVASCDEVSQVAKLVRPSGDVHGSIKVRIDGSGLISNFRPLGAKVWGNDIASTRQVEDDEQEDVPFSARHAKSRMMPDDGGDRPALKHAKTTQPQEMHFIAPQDCTPGNPVCLHGPHGDPIMVPMPEGAEPGKPCSIYLGPKSAFSVVVPEGAFPGSVVIFTMEDDGEMLTTIVPPGKMPGDSFDIVPPVLLIQVPHGCKGGDEVVYTTPAGTPAVVQVPLGFAAGHYFSTLLPVDKNLAEVAMNNQGVSKTLKAKTMEQVAAEARASKDEGSSSQDSAGNTTLFDVDSAAVAALVDLDGPARAVNGSDSTACLASELEEKVVVTDVMADFPEREGGYQSELDVMADFPDDELTLMPEDSPSAEAVRPSSPTSSNSSPEGEKETEAPVAKATTPLLSDTEGSI